MATPVMVRVRDTLPARWADLLADAQAEGFRSAERLEREWLGGTVRFDGPGEALMAAYVGAELARVGGITQDPFLSGALRMRRLYVRPAYRRVGLGRAIAAALLKLPRDPAQPVVVNAGTTLAPPFWAALGFIPDRRDSHTHVLAEPVRHVLL